MFKTENNNMKINTVIFIILLFAYLFLVQEVKAENIYFNNDTYVLKSGRFSHINNGYENEYFPEKDEKDNWNKMIGIYYFPEIKDPIKFAQNADKEIETKATVILLKFIANKKQNKAVLSFLDSGEIDGKAYFEHNIYKYEPHSGKGMMILRYAKRYFASNNEDAEHIAKEIKGINDDLMEQIIISPMPILVEKEID